MSPQVPFLNIRAQGFYILAAFIYRRRMKMDLVYILTGLAFGLITGWVLNNFVGKKSRTQTLKESNRILTDAAHEADDLKKEKVLEVEEENFEIRQKMENEYQSKKDSLRKFESGLLTKDNNIDRKADLVEKKERDTIHKEKELIIRTNSLNIRQKKLDESIDEANHKLEHLSGLTSDEAKKILMDNLIEEAKTEAAHTIYSITEKAKITAKEESRNILITSMEQIVSTNTIESTVTTVSLPSDDMKGRIIGKEGRNIRSFEIVTGVDVIVDDTPQAVLLSAFDPYRRELAKVTMERLVSDGRIHPGRIEEMYEKVLKEMDEYFTEVGEVVLHDLGIIGLHPEIVKTLGKLKYRSNYGQNVLQHCKEVAELSGILGALLDLDTKLLRRAGILHKIGLVLNKSVDSDYSKVGHDFIKKYGEHPLVLNAILAFNHKELANSPMPFILKLADQISRKRPGAQREVIENYVKRLRSLEETVDAFEGVKTAYAIQAGKEIRIIIDHTKADDAMSNQLAIDVARQIKKEYGKTVPLKINVIREFRAVDYA